LGTLVYHGSVAGSLAGEIGIEGVSTNNFDLSRHTGWPVSGTVGHAHGYPALQQRAHYGLAEGAGAKDQVSFRHSVAPFELNKMDRIFRMLIFMDK
jgi:hypothetical protein